MNMARSSWRWVLSWLEWIWLHERYGLARLVIGIALPCLWLFFGVVAFKGDVLHALGCLIAPVVGLVSAFFLAARYVQDVYSLESLRLGMEYLSASFLNIGYPHLEIADGQKMIGEGKTNLLDAVGGPGYITIQPGNVVLFERLYAPSEVRAAGRHYVSRFEMIKEIVSLDEYACEPFDFHVMTKDGVPINVRDVQFCYRLWTGPQRDTPARLYPYSVEAVRNLVYHRAVGKDGLTSWEKTVTSVVKGEITAYISSHPVDYITAPRYTGGDPRQELKRRIESGRLRERLRHIGTQLIWFDIGHFDIEADEGERERINVLLEKWRGYAAAERAGGEAKRLAYQELGRAEAQAEMLMSILGALEDVSLSDKPAENVRRIVLARTAQILEALSSSFARPSSPPPSSDSKRRRT